MMRGFLAAVAVLVVTGCDAASGLVSSSEPLTSKVLNVGGAEITVGTAGGYCINDRQTRYTIAGAFVLMAPCDPDDKNGPNGLVLVNVLSQNPMEQALNEGTMDAFIRSDTGKAALSSKGTSDTVDVLGTMETDGIYYVHTMDRAGPIIPDTTDEHWRSFFVVKERLVSVSAVNFVDDPTPDGLLFAKIEEISIKIKDLNR